jgi:hypothetical protein
MSEMFLTKLLHVRNIAQFTFWKSKTLYFWHTMCTHLPQPKYYIVILQFVPNVVQHTPQHTQSLPDIEVLFM